MAVLGSSKVPLPSETVGVILNKVKEKSTIAALSPAKPKKFVDESDMIFNPAAEAEVVEEGAQKAYYDNNITSVKAARITFQTTTRVSSQLKWADEDNQLEIVTNIMQDQSEACARLIDYVLYHAINPLPKTTLSGVTPLATSAQQVAATGDPTADLDALLDAVIEEWEANGIALSRGFANALRKVRVPATGARLYPDINLSLDVSNLEGLNASVSNTVNGDARRSTKSGILSFAGDFSVIRWGMVRDMTAEIIEFGDPDGQGDLKRNNQIAYRTEGVLGYAVLDASAIACLKDSSGAYAFTGTGARAAAAKSRKAA